MLNLYDGLVNFATGRGTSVDRGALNRWYDTTLTPQDIEAAYRTSWLMAKIVNLPPRDMVREWRDWQIDKADITRVEREEKRLGVRSKIEKALRYGRLGGGAMIIGFGDADPSRPAPTTVRPGGVKYLHVVSRHRINIGNQDTDPASPTFGQPTWYMLPGARGVALIHPSRVIPFRGDMVPDMGAQSWEDLFWGDSVVKRVNQAVQEAMTATGGFASLIDEAKIDVWRLKDFMNNLAHNDEVVTKRVQYTNAAKSTHRAVILDSEDEFEQRQITWNGMPDVIRTYLSIVAGASDIPATRLLGKAPDGMNATGEGDERNYRDLIAGLQDSDLRPALDVLDPFLLQSAGVPADAFWTFAPLARPTEQEAADIAKKKAETVNIYATAGLVPSAALETATQNMLVEDGWLPGLEDALATSATDMATPINDAMPRPLYVHRKLLNASDLVEWAKENGFTSTLPAADMHVTVLYSRTAVDPIAMGETWTGNEKGELVVKPGGPRAVERLGENAVVLMFASSDLVWRHKEMVERGASHDYAEYQPHVTLTYDIPPDLDLAALKPYAGELRFGPEIFEPLDLEWKEKVVEE